MLTVNTDTTISFTGLHYRNPYPRAVSNHQYIRQVPFFLSVWAIVLLRNFIQLFCCLNIPVDIPASNGTGHSERQEAAGTAAPEEAGQANLLTVT